MKNLLLPIAALCSVMMSCTNNSKPDPHPFSPYAISTSGKVLVADVKLLSTNAQEQVVVTDLPSCKIMILDSSSNTGKPLTIAEFEYKDGSAVIDMDKAAINAVQPIEKFFAKFSGAVITNKEAKYILAIPKAVDAKGDVIAPLLLSDVNIQTMKATLADQWIYLTQATRVSLKSNLGSLQVDLDLDFRKGWNNLVTVADFATSQLTLRANTLPATGLQWANVIEVAI